MNSKARYLKGSYSLFDRKRMTRKKKGSILDIFPVMVILFLTAITLIICYLAWSRIDVSGLFSDSPEANEAMQSSGRALRAYDNMTVFVFIMLSLVVIVLASQIATHPAWFFISLFVLAIAGIVAVMMANAFEDVTTVDAFNETITQFDKTIFLVHHMPLYALFMCFAVAI